MAILQASVFVNSFDFLRVSLHFQNQSPVTTFDVGGASMQVSSDKMRDEGTWTPENLTLFRNDYQ